MKKSRQLRIIPAKEALRFVTTPQWDESLARTVSGIIDEVRRGGDRALIRLSAKFDRVRISSVRLKPRFPRIPADLKRDMLFSWKRILKYHKEFLSSSAVRDESNGVRWGRILRPITRAGLYIPGGSAPLFSTLLMTAGAARAAGVKELVVATPPPVHEAILAAAEIAGVTEIIQVGGAQAIAALAFGTKSVRPVDKIFGPGNRFVTEAKRQVFGVVGIDSLAGPTEVLIIADRTASPEVVAADMLAQAEHSPDARPILVTTDRALARKVFDELMVQIATLPRRLLAAQALEKNGLIVLCRSRAEMIEVANAFAPEHLSVVTADPCGIVRKLTAAGAIFVGHEAAEAMGDYVTGPNHVLPTSRTARFSGPLSGDDFLSSSSVQSLSPAALRRLAPVAARLARVEGLEAHARSIEARLRETSGFSGKRKR